MVSLGPRVRLRSRSVIGPATGQHGGDSGPIALVSFGIATIVRQPAVPIGTMLGLPYLFPIVISLVSQPH
jgi:hypothetical protein